MDYEDEDRKRRIPAHREVILGGLSRFSIISTSLLIPLDVVGMRFKYSDAWCVKMFRLMVTSNGAFGPYKVLNATMLQREALSSLRWGIYYCLYDSHKRNCLLKGWNPLGMGKYLLTNRPIVSYALRVQRSALVLDYLHERRRLRERNIFSRFANNVQSQVKSMLQTGIKKMNVQSWPLNALTASIIASTLLHPLDVFKVRLQLYPEMWGMSLLRNMLRCEGIRAPYTGLTASILRQTTYTTSRLGTYYCLYEHHKKKYDSIPSFSEKLLIGVYAGLVGAFVGCPSEIVLVRMMADGPVDPYRRYRSLIDAFTKIWQTEGACTLWRGALLTMSRSAVISVSQIGTYSQARNYLVEKKRTKGFLLHLYTSMLSSLVTAVATLPLDTFKTRYQVTSNGSHRDVYNKFRQESGILGLWRGFTPYYVRLTIHTLITFYLLEMLYDVHKNKKNPPASKTS
ncbi:mitochondrial 2-oxoglutarate/malate carrier protein-like [Helicoverpa zea]|uniref:mitochondrial 2-oxoglutarate/malate carrier protein-like n=1 Tax=Helicoverpa zea TaxID=7113 RepID=UPI001F5976D6|nr:mitochondrial 2-oxoglutarate/malate carrier protein-like [Helicoverpa zea]